MSFPAISSVPSPDALVAEVLVAGYGLPPTTTCRFHQVGLNDTFFVESDSSRFVLRVYRAGWRSIPDVVYELDALEHLAGKGVSVSTPIRRKDVHRITRLQMPEGERPAVLFTWAPGQPLKGDETDAVDFGRSCAEIHSATDDFHSVQQRFKLDLAHLLDEPMELLRPNLAHRPEDWKFLQALADRLRQRISAMDQSALDRGFCHGDFRGGNAHREGNRLTHFDFDCCGEGSRAYDIAVYRWSSRIAGKESEAKRWPKFLAGYNEVRKLSEADLAATALFVPLHDIWLMGVHMHGAPRWGFHLFGDSYFDRHFHMLRQMQAEYLDA